MDIDLDRRLSYYCAELLFEKVMYGQKQINFFPNLRSKMIYSWHHFGIYTGVDVLYFQRVWGGRQLGESN